MKKYAPFLILLFLVFGVQAQTIKTADAKRLEIVEKSIQDTQRKITEEEIVLAELRAKFTDDYIRNKESKQRIEDLNKTLIALNLERKHLLSKKLIENLPKNNTLLLQMIVVQNEKIIELLEKLTSQ